MASTTIQGAVTASSAGDTIVVCPGTYAEQVTVPADKDRLTLISSSRRQAVIEAPPAYTPGNVDLVRVNGAEDVSFASFTITGPHPDVGVYCNPQLVSNVRIGQGGSANLVDNRITQAKPTNPALRGLPERLRRPDRPCRGERHRHRPPLLQRDRRLQQGRRLRRQHRLGADRRGQHRARPR